MWTKETALLLYSTMIFAAKDLGSLILRFSVFFFADLLAWRTPYPSHPNIRRIINFFEIFYRSTQPTKNLSELRSNGDRLS